MQEGFLSTCIFLMTKFLYSPRYVLTVSMGMLAIAHIYRQITDYGGYTLDFTGYDNMSLISYYKREW